MNGSQHFFLFRAEIVSLTRFWRKIYKEFRIKVLKNDFFIDFEVDFAKLGLYIVQCSDNYLREHGCVKTVANIINL